MKRRWIRTRSQYHSVMTSRAERYKRLKRMNAPDIIINNEKELLLQSYPKYVINGISQRIRDIIVPHIWYDFRLAVAHVKLTGEPFFETLKAVRNDTLLDTEELEYINNVVEMEEYTDA